MNTLEQKIEALLLYKNEPVGYSWLAKYLGITDQESREIVSGMSRYYEGRGITLVTTNDDAALMTGGIATDIIRKLTSSDEHKELSKQALETLAIIVYRSPITKVEIDYIRGVNSVFILRNLLVRGLIEKKTNLVDKRSPLYVPTHDLLSYLGVRNKEELPDFRILEQRITAIEEQHKHEERISAEPLVVGDHDANKTV